MMPECDCGSHVSESFCRVFGDNDGDVEACYDCRTKQDVRHGAAADEDRVAHLENAERHIPREHRVNHEIDAGGGA